MGEQKKSRIFNKDWQGLARATRAGKGWQGLARAGKGWQNPAQICAHCGEPSGEPEFYSNPYALQPLALEQAPLTN